MSKQFKSKQFVQMSLINDYTYDLFPLMPLLLIKPFLFNSFSQDRIPAFESCDLNAIRYSVRRKPKEKKKKKTNLCSRIIRRSDIFPLQLRIQKVSLSDMF